MTDATGDTFDFVIIGAGAAGEAALELARETGHSVAVIERDLFLPLGTQVRIGPVLPCSQGKTGP